VNVTHYHVTERIGKTERVVATFASAFQAGRDMALRERSSQVTEHVRQDDPMVAFQSADDDRRDAGRRDAPPRPIISYMACCCTTETVPHPG
jgi:hypothetical protein